MESRTTRIHRQLAERDGGWSCSYCGCEMVPSDTDPTEVGGVIVPESRCFCGVSHCGECDGNPCVNEAHWSFPPGLQWPTMDHVVPKSKGGSDDLDNLVLACRTCNCRKATRNVWKFLAELRVIA